mgnify:CR=1 FL=1
MKLSIFRVVMSLQDVGQLCYTFTNVIHSLPPSKHIVLRLDPKSNTSSFIIACPLAKINSFFNNVD